MYYGIYCLFASYMVTYLTMAGYSPVFCGVAGTVTYLVSILTQPLLGYLSDSLLPMGRCLQLAAGVTLLGTLLLPGALGSPAATLLVLTLVAAACLPMMSLLDVWVMAAKEDTPELSFPLARMGGSLGYGVWSLLIGEAVERFGTALIFQIQALFCVVFLVLLHWLPQVSMHNRRSRVRTIPPLRSFQLIWRDRGFRFAVVLLLLHWLTHRLMGSYLALLIQAIGGSTAVFGVVVGLGGFAEAVIPLFGARWIRCCPVRRLLAICLALNFARPVLCLLSIPFGTGFFAAGQILQSIGFSIYFTASVECLSRLAPVQVKNTAISLGLALSSLLGTVLANFAGGVLVQWFGALSLVRPTLVLALLNLLWLSTQVRRFPQLGPSAAQWDAGRRN